MQEALRNRLTYGPIMLVGLGLLLVLDAVIQNSSADFMLRHFNHAQGLRGVGILALLVLICPIATVELTRMFAAEHVRPYPILAAAGATALVLHAFMTQFAWFRPVAASVLMLLVILGMLAAALRRAMDRQTDDAIVRMAGTVLATLYLGGLSWFLLALRVKDSSHIRGSTMMILMILLVVKFTDIGAYFGGRALGKHKLIPWLSPGKTWEGLFFGLLTAGAVGMICSRFIGNPDPIFNDPTYVLEWWKGAIFGVVIGAVGQLGDLLESLMKRDAQVKDSGSIIPGFGGVLDVIDSPLLAAPFAYVLFSLF